MKLVFCKDCSKDECVPNCMPEPWICKDCQALHNLNSLADLEEC